MAQINSDEQAWKWLGSEVSSRRGVLHLTQQELADAVGVTVKTINTLEAGRKRGMRATTVADLERELAWPSGTVERVLRGALGPRDDHRTAPSRQRAMDEAIKRALEAPASDSQGNEYVRDVVAAMHMSDLDTQRTVAAVVGQITNLSKRLTSNSGFSTSEPTSSAPEDYALAGPAERQGIPALDTSRTAQDEAAEATQLRADDDDHSA